MPRIRPATPDDAGAMRRLHTAAVRELTASHYDADQREAWAAPDADRDGFPFDDTDHHLVVATRDGLGLPEREQEGDITFFELQGTWLALYPWDALDDDATVDPDGSGFRGVTIAHNAESREAVEDILAAAEAAGATITKPAQDVFWGGYSGYFEDPDGHLWEVAWNRNWEFQD